MAGRSPPSATTSSQILRRGSRGSDFIDCEQVSLLRRAPERGAVVGVAAVALSSAPASTEIERDNKNARRGKKRVFRYPSSTGYRLLIAVAATAVCVAQAEQPLIAHLDAGSFKEAVRNDAPVAGGDVMGLVVDLREAPVDGGKLYVRIPRRPVSRICIEATTLNGGYLASNTYTVPAAPAGSFVEIPVDATRPLGTSHPEFFRPSSPRALAVLARTGACSDASSALLPASWGRPSHPGGRLPFTLAVQSGRATVSMVATPRSAATEACESLTQGRRTAYDVLCSGDLSPDGHSDVELQLQTCAYDDCSPPYRVRIAL